MARRILILLIAILAFQLNWNVAAAYCMHETGRAPMHLGHHEHHATSDELAAGAGHDEASTEQPLKQPTKQPAGHDAHCATGLHIALAVPGPVAAAPPIETTQDLAPGPGVVPASAFLSPPERPQWASRA